VVDVGTAVTADAVLTNNIFAGDFLESANPTLTTNLFVVADPESTYTDGGGNIWGSNPRWRADYRLKLGSPAKHRGTQITGITTYYNEKTIVGNPNIGPMPSVNNPFLDIILK